MKMINTKSGIFLAATAALLFVNSLNVFAQSSNVHLNLYKTGTAIAEIKIDQLKSEEPASISIKNTDGVTLFSDKSKADRYVKMIDFSSISDGIYVVDIAQTKGRVRKVLKKENQTLTIEDQAYVFNNYVKFPEERKLLVKFNNQIDEPVTLRISDSNGNILHEEANIKTENYTALFNLSKLTKGSYNMSLTSGTYSNTQKIQL